MRPRSTKRWFHWLRWTFAALALFLSHRANAQGAVIEAGREDDVLALLAPFAPGSVIDGWRIENVAIEMASIDIVFVPENDEATPEAVAPYLHLVHHGQDDGGSDNSVETRSFLISFHGFHQDTRARQSLRVLAEAIEANDDGTFWAHAPTITGDAPPPIRERLDYLLLTFFFFLAVIGVSFHVCTARITLLVITLMGIALRIALSPQTLLGAWFYSRTTDMQRALLRSPLLLEANAFLEESWAEIDILCAIGLAFACVTPLAIYLHARLLLGSEKRALMAATMIALLPMHIRFSWSEVAFIPSLVLSSCLFASAHGVLKGAPRVAVPATVAMVALTAATLSARPLNFLFILLLWFYVGAISQAPRRRRIIVALLSTATAVPFIFGEFLHYYGDNVRDGASLRVVTDAFWLLFDVDRNTLLNPRITPWWLTVSALAAVVAVRPLAQLQQGFRRVLARPKQTGEDASTSSVETDQGDAAQFAKTNSQPDEATEVPNGVSHATRRVTLFLLTWLGLFFGTHAYVVPLAPAMQARYHLHLVVPFIFLAVLGSEFLWARWRTMAASPRRTVTGTISVILLLWMAGAPFFHRSFIQDTAYNGLDELAFVRRAASQIEPGCAVVEFASRDLHARFRRGGRRLEGGGYQLPYTLYVHTFESPWTPPVESCLYVYEGLSCFAEKAPNEDIAPQCQEMLAAFPLETVDSTSYANRIYDGNQTRGLMHMDRIRLVLHRVAPRSSQ